MIVFRGAVGFGARGGGAAPPRALVAGDVGEGAHAGALLVAGLGPAYVGRREVVEDDADPGEVRGDQGHRDVNDLRGLPAQDVYPSQLASAVMGVPRQDLRSPPRTDLLDVPRTFCVFCVP